MVTREYAPILRPGYTGAAGSRGSFQCSTTAFLPGHKRAGAVRLSYFVAAPVRECGNIVPEGFNPATVQPAGGLMCLAGIAGSYRSVLDILEPVWDLSGVNSGFLRCPKWVHGSAIRVHAAQRFIP